MYAFLKGVKNDEVQYTNLNNPIISKSRKTMTNLNGISFMALDSDDPHVVAQKQHCYKGLKKMNSVESEPSSDESNTPRSERSSPIRGISSPVTKSRGNISKFAGKTVKSVINTLSPKPPKRHIPLPTPSEPVWPNSMNTFNRGIMKGKQSQMTVPNEPSMLSLKIQIELEEKEKLRVEMQKLNENLNSCLVDLASQEDLENAPNDSSRKTSSLSVNQTSGAESWSPQCQECLRLQSVRGYSVVNSDDSDSSDSSRCGNDRMQNGYLVLSEDLSPDEYTV